MTPSGNTILITGGGSGIGRELARAFHAQGNTVIITGRRADALKDTAEGFPGMAAYALDMQDAAAIRVFGARLIADYPALNAVIHNAGIMVAEDIKAQAGDVSVSEATIETNLLGPIRLTAALLPHLLTKDKAAVVTVSSGLAFVPLVATPTYSATKAAIHSWSQSLREQLKDTPVEVIELAPPGVQTDLMPGHAVNPHMLPLADFMAETMGLFNTQPTPSEILVERVKFLRFAEAEGRFEATFKALNG